MPRRRDERARYRTVRLKIETYRELDEYLVELIRKGGDRKLTLDDAVSSLLKKVKA